MWMIFWLNTNKYNITDFAMYIYITFYLLRSNRNNSEYNDYFRNDINK